VFLQAQPTRFRFNDIDAYIFQQVAQHRPVVRVIVGDQGFDVVLVSDSNDLLFNFFR